jgi:NCAIR mutase (PurE)-related protein
MNENPWLIPGALIGIVAGIAFAPLLAVPVAVALGVGVGGGALSFSAVVGWHHCYLRDN